MLFHVSIRYPAIKSLYLFVILLIIIPSFSFAADFRVGGFFDTGKRTQAEDYEEEDDDSEYTYRKYNLSFEHRLSARVNYKVASNYYDKDYIQSDSNDNLSRISTVNGSYYIRKENEEKLKLDIGFRHKEKRYNESSDSEYDQNVLTPKVTYSVKDIYSVYLSTGINSYDYVSNKGKDEIKIFSKLGGKRYLLAKRLVLSSSFRFESSNRKKEDRREHKNVLMLGAYYIPDVSYIYKITLRVKAGQGDTKDDDDRDDDLDYRFGRFFIKTEHKVNPLLKAGLVYEFFRKDYLTSDLDHRGFYIKNTWRQSIIADKDRELYIIAAAVHKDVNYPIKPQRDYRKDTLEVKGVIMKRRDWKTSLSLRGDFYDYSDSTGDKNRYYARLLLKRYFFDKRLDLSLNLKYKYTDNRHSNNTEEESGRLAFAYRF